VTRHAKPRSPLRSLRTSAAFRDFVLDQLSEVAAISARPMFGGLGLYSGDVFFGLVAADVLYLKVDAATRPAFEAAGSSAFAPYGGPGVMSSYFSVPLDVLEHAPTLVVWARRAIEVARAEATPGRRR
jgi:DNA transformation protein